MAGIGNQAAAPSIQVVVVGGGLAGISAACTLADRGVRVKLLEKRPFLGGRTYSFVDKELGVEVDNGQHVFMKCCTFYIDLLRKLGVLDRTRVQRRLRVDVYDSDQNRSAIYSAPLPSPLHLLPSLLFYKHLSWREKLAVLRGALTMMRLSETRRLALDDVTFSDWLKEHGQSDRAISGFWNLIILPTLNDNASDVSASLAIMVLQQGFFNDPHGADIGYAAVGLSHLLFAEAASFLEQRGGSLLLSQNVEGLEGDAGGISGVRVYGGELLTADAYVLATTSRGLVQLLPSSLRDDGFFQRAHRLNMSPIVNLHVWFDRKVMDLDFAAFPESELQWVFNKDYGTGDSGNGQHLCVSVSAAHNYIDMPKEELHRFFLAELRRAFPEARDAQVTRMISVKERFATFSATPGSAALRLPAKTPVLNLFLAGAWTDTGWPSTMESAVRSGVFCANEIVAAS